MSKVGPGAGQANQCTKIDEDEMKEKLATGLGWAGWGSCTLSAPSQKLCLAPRPPWKPGLGMKGKKKRGFLPKTAMEEVTGGVLRSPCTPSCHTHLACDTRGRNPIVAIPCHHPPGSFLQRGHAWDFLREISSDAKTSQTWVILHHPETASCRERPRKSEEDTRQQWPNRHARIGCRRAERQILCLLVPC